jgi:hypothetical protein
MVWNNSARGQMSWPIHGVCKFHRHKKTPWPGVDTRSGTQRTQRDAENAERSKVDLRTRFSAFSAPLGVLRVEAFVRRWARNGCPSPMAADRKIPEPGRVGTRSGTRRTRREAKPI